MRIEFAGVIGLNLIKLIECIFEITQKKTTCDIWNAFGFRFH